MIAIRQLLPPDSLLWKNLRIQALTNNPASFGASLEEEMRLTEIEIKKWFAQNIILGAFSDHCLVGTLGLCILEETRCAHRGLLRGMYVDPKYRGEGIASRLLGAMLTIARTKVLQVHLEVVSHNHAAIELYYRYGFQCTGTDLRCLKIGTQFYDEYLMVLIFD